MRILWLTNDRTRQVLDSFTCLRTAVGQLCEVESIVRPLTVLEVDLCRAACNGQDTEPLVNPDYANTFDWIVCDAPWSFLSEDWCNIDAKVAVMWADQHGAMVAHYIGRFFHQFHAERFMPLYRDSTAQFHSYIPPEQVSHMPVWIDPEQFKQWGLAKQYDVLLTGAVHPVVYQLRQEVWEQCNGKPWFTRIERPHYEFDPFAKGRWPLAHDFGRLLNQAHIAVTCVSRFGYPIGKVFEIPASHAALACDWCPEMADLGFVPGHNFLLLRVGEDHAVTLSRYLEQVDLARVAAAGHLLVQSRHTAKARALELVRALI